MAARGDGYSRFVALIKVVLPLIALGILSTLFLVSRYRDAAQPIPFADVDVEQLAREQRIGEPTISAVSEDGSAVTISANSAHPVPDQPGEIEIDRPQIRIETPNGTTIEASALKGLVDNEDKIFVISGQTVATTSAGYRLQTERLVARFDRTRITATGGVLANGPLGSISADSMELQSVNAKDDGDSYVLVFTDRVKLIYDPEKR